MNMFTSSRTFSTAIIIGLMGVMLASYQNCGKASFSRTGEESQNKPCSENVTGCAPGPGAEIVPVVQNGNNETIGDQESTCKGLLPNDIANGRNREISITLLSLHYIPSGYFCLRVSPITDTAHYKCSLPYDPTHTLRPDNNSSSPLGDFTVLNSENTSVKLHYVDVLNGSYELEFYGHWSQNNVEHHTNPARVRFTVSNCDSTPNPTPSPAPSPSATPTPNPSPGPGPSPGPTPSPGSCQPNYYNSQAECLQNHASCERKFECVQEPCNCSWGPVTVTLHECTACPACPKGDSSCTDGLCQTGQFARYEQCCALSSSAPTTVYTWDGAPLACTRPSH